MEVDQPVNYMRLGDTAIDALEVFDSSGENAPKSSAYSLFGLLDKTRTVGGKHLLESWLKQPLCDLARISQRHDIVEAFNGANECRDALHANYLRKVNDVIPVSKALKQGKAKLDDCYKLYRSICALRSMIEKLADVESCDAVQELILTPLKESACELNKMCDLVETTVVFNEASHRYCINPEIDVNLNELNDKLVDLRDRAQLVADELKAETGADHMKLETNEEGFFFRVTLKSEKNVRKAEVTVLNCTKGGGLVFTNPSLQKLNDQFCDLNSQYDENQSEVADSVIKTCATYADACEALGHKIALLDVLISFSVVCCGSANPFVRPELFEQGSNIFELRECRHPIVEIIPYAPTFIPNDICFDKECRFATLTGPNMGGKSTFLKATAVTVLLAQIGCFVPCTTARISLIDSILCRVGAGDIQFKGASTFMVEMQDVATILKEATPDSLVIIDELGRGTSTFDGFGLVYAVSEEIVCKLKSMCILATHFHEMAQLKRVYPTKVQNLKVETHLDENGLMTILHKISEGVSDKSFGISIARQVGFSEDIIQDAERVLNSLEKSGISELNARVADGLKAEV